MASTLLIQKDSGGYFIFTLTVDSIVQEPIRNMRNDALCTGNLVNIKTANGANLVKYQNISIFDITLISGGTFTFTNVDVFLNKLIEVGFYDWLTFIGGGGGGGVNRFDQLIDTFDYFGNDSKAVRVNESQLKLETFTVYNYRNLTELEDTFDTIVPNKMLVTNNAGTKVELADLPTPPEQYLQSVGFFDYADLETQTTPLVLVSNVSKKLTNDTLGVSTNTSNAPYGVSSLWDSSTNTFNFSQLSIGDTIDIRFDVNVTTTVSNQIVKGYVKLGVGSPSEYILGIFGQQIKTPASNTQTVFTSIYIGNTDLIDYPSEVYLLTENSGSAKVNGWYCRVLRKGINIVDISIDSDYHDATAKTTIVDADEIAGQNSASLFSTMKFTALNFWNYIKSKADARYALITDLVNYYTKSEIDSKISSVYKYKGNVANYASLPTTGRVVGDVWNAIDTDINWAWTGTVWDNIGGTFDISSKQDVLTETNFGAFENSLTAKATPIDADFISIVDTADSNKAKKTTFTQLKAFFKSYYDGIYQAILVSGTNIKTVNGASLLGSGNVVTGDMDLTTAQTVSGVKTFLDGKLGLRNVANTFTSFITNSVTASRTWTLQDRNGILADDTDLIPQITITTSVSITTDTNASNGLGQKGRNVVISNGASAINLTVNGGTDFCASYLKGGTGAITFVQGSGRTLIQVDSMAVLNGIAGSTATITSVGTIDYLRISNA